MSNEAQCLVNDITSTIREVEDLSAGLKRNIKLLDHKAKVLHRYLERALALSGQPPADETVVYAGQPKDDPQDPPANNEN